jgi:hypothetical protein
MKGDTRVFKTQYREACRVILIWRFCNLGGEVRLRKRQLQIVGVR